MEATLSVRIPAHLESAVQRVRMAARSAAERTVDSLSLAAMASSNVFQRDALMGAQFELNRKLAIFALTFNETLDKRIAREVRQLLGQPEAAGHLTSWDALSLVDDREVEIQVTADRFALEISHTCEWEIRELDAFMGALFKLDGADHDRNPLRAEVVGQAMIRAVDSVADRPEVSKVLGTEIGRALAQTMRETYVAIVADLRAAGIQPVGLTVRQRHADGGGSNGRHSRPGTLHGDLNSDPHDGGQHHHTAYGGHNGHHHGGRGQAHAHSNWSDLPTGHHGGRGTPMGSVDGQLMSLIRQLSSSNSAHWADSNPNLSGGWADDRMEPSHGSMAAPNLILAHREELRQAATGAIDHMVIDVIAGLFDQILSDPKVPPQMARQIGRLQLPVLRAALGDTSFFSSRKHPVRRFINRIASLGSAVDDFECDEGQALLLRVRELVQEVVEGDFEQIETYEHKLSALEQFIADQAKSRLAANGSADLVLARKEDELRVQHRFAEQLDGALHPLPVPEFLRQFLGQIWSRAISSTELSTGQNSAMTLRMREVARELVMSVQPKGLPAQRAVFLRQLPQMMKDLNAGLDRIRCTEPVRREFFAQLLPAHAEALKGQALSTLEHNLLAKQVESVLATPLPKAADLPRVTEATRPILNESANAGHFSAEEARAVGLVDESAVDWNGKIDIDLGTETDGANPDLGLRGLPKAEPAEPTRGKSLADHVQIGQAYQMHLEGVWEKVRLDHVSEARSFFVFTHGNKQRKTISMTYRMLSRMCETSRMRAFEGASLLDRAAERTRRQLAQVGRIAGPPAAHTPPRKIS